MIEFLISNRFNVFIRAIFDNNSVRQRYFQTDTPEMIHHRMEFTQISARGQRQLKSGPVLIQKFFNPAKVAF